jgi:hypothetical protein
MTAIPRIAAKNAFRFIRSPSAWFEGAASDALAPHMGSAQSM